MGEISLSWQQWVLSVLPWKSWDSITTAFKAGINLEDDICCTLLENLRGTRFSIRVTFLQVLSSMGWRILRQNITRYEWDYSPMHVMMSWWHDSVARWKLISFYGVKLLSNRGLAVEWNSGKSQDLHCTCMYSCLQCTVWIACPSLYKKYVINL